MENTLEAQTCCVCGVVFGMLPALAKFRRADAKQFFCPNGHAQSYTETDGQRLEKATVELGTKSARIAWLEKAEKDAIDAQCALQDALAEQKRQNARLQKRATSLTKVAAAKLHMAIPTPFAPVPVHSTLPDVKTTSPAYIEQYLMDHPGQNTRQVADALGVSQQKIAGVKGGMARAKNCRSKRNIENQTA